MAGAIMQRRPHFGGVIEQADLHFFFGSKVREQSTFGHSHLIGQYAERHAVQTGPAHQGQPPIENAPARGG
jgi:hypothetical protein